MIEGDMIPFSWNQNDLAKEYVQKKSKEISKVKYKLKYKEKEGAKEQIECCIYPHIGGIIADHVQVPN